MSNDNKISRDRQSATFIRGLLSKRSGRSLDCADPTSGVRVSWGTSLGPEKKDGNDATYDGSPYK
jgi:hypothetical protein